MRKMEIKNSAADAATTEREFYPVIETMLKGIVNSEDPMPVIETAVKSDTVGYFGVALWTRDFKQLEISTFYLGVDGISGLAKVWDMAVCSLPQMFNERWGYVPVVEATSQEEIEKKWYNTVYDKYFKKVA